jgi:hypothetical protein
MTMIKHAATAALMLGCAAQALAQEPDDGRDWTLSLSGGTSMVEARGDQPFASIGITRSFGDGYVRVSGTYFDTRDGQGVLGAVPAKTSQVTLAGGVSFGAVSIDAYGTLGKRTFGAETYERRTGRPITIASNGKTAALGASLTYDLPVGGNGFVSPFVALDWSRVDTARAINVPTLGLISQKEKQAGTTGTLGATAQLLFGPDSGHSAGLYGAFVTSSNTTAYNRGASPIAAARVLGASDLPGIKDSWGEIGATASVRLAKPLRLDLSVIRTLGFAGAESTSGAVGVRFSF